MKPCRDCGVPTALSARSCPSCGILNPVLQWVALPNGEHLTRREPVTGGGAAAMSLPAHRAPVFTPAAAAEKPRDVFGGDRLASWAIWLVLFTLLSSFLIGGAIGGIIAAVISLPVGAVLPTRPDGRKLPKAVSIALIGVSVFILVGSIFVNATTP